MGGPGRRSKLVYKWDERLQRPMYALRNRQEWYLTSTGKLDPRFEKARIFVRKQAAVIALKYWRHILNDDSISLKNLLLTVREFD